MAHDIKSIERKYDDLIEAISQVDMPFAQEHVAELRKMSVKLVASLKNPPRPILSDEDIRKELKRIGCVPTASGNFIEIDIKSRGSRLLRHQRTRKHYQLNQVGRTLELQELSEAPRLTTTDEVYFLFQDEI